MLLLTEVLFEADSSHLASAGQGAAVLYQCNSTFVCCDNGNNGSLCCEEESQKFFIGTPQNLTQAFANFTLPDPRTSSSSSSSSSAGGTTATATSVYAGAASSQQAQTDAPAAQQPSDSKRTMKLAIAIGVPAAVLLALASSIATCLIIRRKNRRLDELENHVRVLSHAMAAGSKEKPDWMTSTGAGKSPWYDDSPASQPAPTSVTNGRAELLDGRHEDAKELSGRHIGMSFGGLMKGRFGSSTRQNSASTLHEKGRGLLDEHQTMNEDRDRDGYYRPHPALRSDQKVGGYGQATPSGSEIYSQYSIVPPYRSASAYRREPRSGGSAINRTGTTSPSSIHSHQIHNGFDERPDSRTGVDGIAIARPLNLSQSALHSPRGLQSPSRSKRNLQRSNSEADSDTGPISSHEDIGTLASATSPFGGPQPYRSKYATSTTHLPLTTPSGSGTGLRRTNTDGVSPTEEKGESPVRGPSRHGQLPLLMQHNASGISRGDTVSPIRGVVSRDGSFGHRDHGGGGGGGSATVSRAGSERWKGGPLASKPLPQSPVYSTVDF